MADSRRTVALRDAVRERFVDQLLGPAHEGRAAGAAWIGDVLRDVFLRPAVVHGAELGNRFERGVVSRRLRELAGIGCYFQPLEQMPMANGHVMAHVCDVARERARLVETREARL